MIEPRQIRAARALLNWNQQYLAEVSGVAVSSVKNIENGITTARRETIDDIQSAFENAGVEFLSGSGVRMKNELIHIDEHDGANERLLNDIYHSLKGLPEPESEVLLYGIDESLASENLGQEKLDSHIDRLNKANIKEKILVRNGDHNFVNDPSFYKWIPEKYFSPTPIQIYADKIALITFRPREKVIVIENAQLADAFKKLFYFVWDKAEPVTVV